jgi:hypothetical protein
VLTTTILVEIRACETKSKLGLGFDLGKAMET